MVLAGGASVCVGGSDGLVKWTSNCMPSLERPVVAVVVMPSMIILRRGQNVTHLLLHCSGRFLGRNFCASSYR